MDENRRSEWIGDLHRRYYDILITKGNAHIHYDPVLRNSVEDCVNEAFVTAWEKADKVSRYEDAYGWLLKVVCNKLDNVRTKRSTRISQSAVPLECAQEIKLRDPAAERRMEAWFAESEKKDVLEELMSLLSKRENEICEDYFVKRKKAKEIHEERGMSIGAVRATIRRIRTKAARFKNGNMFILLIAVGTLFTFCQI